MTMPAPHTQVGDRVEGYGFGYFGRDSWDTKVCIAAGFYSGTRYAVFCEEQSAPSFYTIWGADLDGLESSVADARAFIS